MGLRTSVLSALVSLVISGLAQAVQAEGPWGAHPAYRSERFIDVFASDGTLHRLFFSYNASVDMRYWQTGQADDWFEGRFKDDRQCHWQYRNNAWRRFDSQDQTSPVQQPSNPVSDILGGDLVPPVRLSERTINNYFLAAMLDLEQEFEEDWQFVANIFDQVDVDLGEPTTLISAPTAALLGLATIPVIGIKEGGQIFGPCLRD